MFLSLFIIMFLGVLGGILFEKLKLPKLIWYLILGILIGPSVLSIIDTNLLNISSYLRQIALVIILTRSGLSLDINVLKKIGRPAFLMCFVPATCEIIGTTIFAPILLNISHIEALLLGSVLGAVSPAVVVPRMIKLQQEGYGENHHVSELIMAGASCDDIYVIILFYAFKNLVSTNNFNSLSLLNIPLSIILGIILGIGLGFILSKFIKKFSSSIQVIFLLAISFGLLFLEDILKPYISISSLLSIITMSITFKKLDKETSSSIQIKYNNLWSFFEIILFTLVGACVDIHYAFSTNGLFMILLILIALIFRSIGILICLICTNYNFKEKTFIIISYLPKATVQASIGAICLNEGLECGTIVLLGAVISILLSAPIGAILMDTSYKKLLNKN